MEEKHSTISELLHVGENITEAVNEEENDGELTLSLPPTESPTHRVKSEISPRSPKRSPRKQHTNLLNIDTSATLAAISARLAIVIPPAESEITRINREILASMANQAANVSPTGLNSPVGITDRNCPISDLMSPSSPSSKGGMTSALHDSVIAEEWVNLHLETSGGFLLPVRDISILKNDDDEVDLESEAFAFRKRNTSGPLARAGIDRFSLYRMGMPKDLVDRLYRALYVYTNGFHNIITEIAAHCPPGAESHVSSNAWLTFLLLLEQCENGKYEMSMLKFKQAAQDAQKRLQNDFTREKAELQAQLHLTETQLMEERARGMEKSELILKLVTETTESNIKIAEQQHQNAVQNEQLRLLKLEVLVHEDEEKKLNELLDDTRKDYEVANSERLNAFSERFALDEEIRKLSVQLERVEAEKTNYAKRMQETLFMNQALRATNDQLKHDVVVLSMEKDKVITEKQSLQEQINDAQTEISQLLAVKLQIDKDLVETQRKQGHLEARIQTMKEEYEIEMENSGKHQQLILRLKAQNEEEKVQLGVLEAKCNLLLAEKQVTGMRPQDKLRIERLLNQKMELETVLETNKLDRKKDQEEICLLRTSLEALDNEMQHLKRVYSAGQQAFLHSERTAEQLRHQTQELEKNYEKAKKNVTSLKERFKMYETSAKEQIIKLEVEVKVASAQLREITYVNKDNVGKIEQLATSLAVSEKEKTVLKISIAESQKHVVELETEKEHLQRNKSELVLASSTSKKVLNRFILSLQNMLALVKLDEFPLDEAVRELLQMVADTFGEELQLDNILAEDDKPMEMELQVVEDVTEEERKSRQRRAAARRNGILSAKTLDDEKETEEFNTTTANSDEKEVSSQREIVRMSRFRKSKLDFLVDKLSREIAHKNDLITNLESVICEQLRTISHLTTTTRQQAQILMLFESQKGMLHSDLDTTCTILRKVRKEKQLVEFALDQVRIENVLQANRAFQLEIAVAILRRDFDQQLIANEDLIAQIWRKYDHDLYVISLRRNKAVQATISIADQHVQTLVPQRNPALERPRVTAFYIPTETSGTAETLLQKISRATRELLPGVAGEMDVHFAVQKPNRSSQKKKSLVRALNSSPRTSRTQLRAQSKRKERKHRICANAAISTLPQLENTKASSCTQILSHVNEFGTLQTVLLSPVRPPISNDYSAANVAVVSPRPPVPQSPHSRKSLPRKLNIDKRLQIKNLQIDSQFEERVETSENYRRQCNSNAISTIPRSLAANIDTSTNSLRFNRSFLRAGMEILRNVSSSDSPLPYPDEEDESEVSFSANEEEDESVQSPSRLVRTVSGYNREQLAQREAAWQNESWTVDEVPNTQNALKKDAEDESELFAQNNQSPFATAVLYPILPK